MLRNLQEDPKLGLDQDGRRAQLGTSGNGGGEQQDGKPESAQPRTHARRPKTQGPSVEGTARSQSRGQGSWRTVELHAQFEGSNPARMVSGRRGTKLQSQRAAAQAKVGRSQSVAGKVAELRRQQQRWMPGAHWSPQSPLPAGGT